MSNNTTQQPDTNTPTTPNAPSIERMPRLWNWRTRFIEFITDTRMDALEKKLSFSWDPSQGMDCMVLCGRAVEAVTGVDKYAEFLNGRKYTDMLSAYKIIRDSGCNNIDQLLRSLFPEKRLEQAHAGDLVSVRVNPEGNLVPVGGSTYAGGVVAPPHFYCMTPQGLGRGWLSHATSCFAVG